MPRLRTTSKRLSAVLLVGLLTAACANGGNGRHAQDAAASGHVSPLAAAGVSREIPSKAPTGAMVDGPTGDLYAATDFGVLRLPAGATHWERAGTGLPQVAVYGITLDQNTGVLYAATHGRGAYAINLPS